MERELVACGTGCGANEAPLGFGWMGGGAAPVDFERTGFGFTCGGIFLAGGCLDANPADPPKFFISPEMSNHFNNVIVYCYYLFAFHPCLFVFAALRPKSTAMVMAGQSVHLTTLFPGQA